MEYIKLNQTFHNMQPRIGLMWDFTGKGRGKFFMNYAKFLETPIPLDLNVRAGSQDSQTDKNFNVNQLNAPNGAPIVPGIRGNLAVGAVNLGATPTPIDPGLRPQTVHETTIGASYEVVRNLTLGVRGIYRAQGDVIEDGSFDDGDNYFLFNPGRRYAGSTEQLACSNPAIGCFGRARRYYRAMEFTATRRFANNWQLYASYVWSSLIGNYEGLFRNDNGQADPNITSLFDLVSLLTVSEVITRAALERTESRGAHYREAYPGKDQGWGNRRIVIHQGPDGMRVRHEPVTPMPPELQAIIQEMQ